jgi:hypothetical protein
MQLMSAAPAAVSITSLRIEKSPSDAAAASAVLTINVSNFRLPLDGFVVIYCVRAPSALDDDSAAYGRPHEFIDAVTYPGAAVLRVTWAARLPYRLSAVFNVDVFASSSNATPPRCRRSYAAQS